jgi:LmbE family N-acetylglucosaminyl deacetylase
VTRTCPACGDQFEVLTWFDPHYCSTTCRHNHQDHRAHQRAAAAAAAAAPAADNRGQRFAAAARDGDVHLSPYQVADLGRVYTQQSTVTVHAPPTPELLTAFGLDQATPLSARSSLWARIRAAIQARRQGRH